MEPALNTGRALSLQKDLRCCQHLPFFFLSLRQKKTVMNFEVAKLFHVFPKIKLDDFLSWQKGYYIVKQKNTVGQDVCRAKYVKFKTSKI